jgi:hypothetical protein
MQMDCLLGYTGFVGINLLRHMKPETFLVNTSNVHEVWGRSFDTVYCCCVYAEKWKANKNPSDDLAHIDDVILTLEKVQCKTFILISTIDVLDCSIPQTEADCGSTYSTHPYGTNRRKIEERCEALFPNCFIFRLPALFGHGLKKNPLFDMIHSHQVDAICAGWKFQWYNLDWLYDDIRECISHGRHLTHLVTPPISIGDIQARFFPTLQLRSDGPTVDYQVGTIHHQARSIESVLSSMKAFIDQRETNRSLLVSQLAWEDDRTAAPWLKSRNLSIEAVPSKHDWDMGRYGSIYSAQSLLYGEQIQIFREQTRFLTLLEERLILLREKGTRVVVFGSPKQRIYAGEDVDALFLRVGRLCRAYDVVFCIENNASVYGGNWMTHIGDVLDLVKRLDHTHIKANLDIGSMIMEQDAFICDDVSHIGHVQVSFPNLGRWDVDHEPYVARILRSLRRMGYVGRISLEVQSETLPFESVESFMQLVNRCYGEYAPE